LYFLGLSTRGVAKAMFFLNKVKRSHVTIWNWIQKCNPKKISSEKMKIKEYTADETLIKLVQS
jgi:putative transposase